MGYNIVDRQVLSRFSREMIKSCEYKCLVHLSISARCKTIWYTNLAPTSLIVLNLA